MSASVQRPEAILQRLEWTVIRRLDGLLQGDYRTLFRGFGLDLAELREYQVGDDVRYIDWNVTARMQSPYIRQYNEDREVTAWFLLDLSPSVDFGTVNTLKRNLLIDFVGLFARLLTRNGNRVGAILYGGAVQGVIPPRNGKAQVLHLVDTLLEQPQLHRTPPTDLGILLNAALSILQRRSLVFLISDFISQPGWHRPLGMLTQRHEVIAIRLFDPREIELPDIGPVFMEDAETGEQIYLDTHDRGFRKRFIEAARRREAELRSAFNRTGVDALSLSTEHDLVKEIVRFATLRKQRSVLSRSVAKPSATRVN
ncbi:MAG: DUF58 domain-containing protein [Spirochaetaceae bacterium]|nr:MAG: DUF58 domain-containing protein [Spirochaetaceae bacterium]